MNAGISREQRQQIIEALEVPIVADTLSVLVEAVNNKNLVTKSLSAIAQALEVIHEIPTCTLSRFESVKEYRKDTTCLAVAGRVIVSGYQVDVLLSEGSFNLTREHHRLYARQVDLILADRVVNVAFLQALVAKEKAGSMSESDKHALKIYRNREVRDFDGEIKLRFDGEIEWTLRPHLDHTWFPGALFMDPNWKPARLG